MNKTIKLIGVLMGVSIIIMSWFIEMSEVNYAMGMLMVWGYLYSLKD